MRERRLCVMCGDFKAWRVPYLLQHLLVLLSLSFLFSLSYFMWACGFKRSVSYFMRACGFKHSMSYFLWACGFKHLASSNMVSEPELWGREISDLGRKFQISVEACLLRFRLQFEAFGVVGWWQFVVASTIHVSRFLEACETTFWKRKPWVATWDRYTPFHSLCEPCLWTIWRLQRFGRHLSWHCNKRCCGWKGLREVGMSLGNCVWG